MEKDSGVTKSLSLGDFLKRSIAGKQTIISQDRANRQRLMVVPTQSKSEATISFAIVRGDHGIGQEMTIPNGAVVTVDAGILHNVLQHFIWLAEYISHLEYCRKFNNFRELQSSIGIINRSMGALLLAPKITTMFTPTGEMLVCGDLLITFKDLERDDVLLDCMRVMTRKTTFNSFPEIVIPGSHFDNSMKQTNGKEALSVQERIPEEVQKLMENLKDGE